MRNRGFTIVELMVAIVIVSVLSLLGIISIQKIIAKAYDMQALGLHTEIMRVGEEIANEYGHYYWCQTSSWDDGHMRCYGTPYESTQTYDNKLNGFGVNWTYCGPGAHGAANTAPCYTDNQYSGWTFHCLGKWMYVQETFYGKPYRIAISAWPDCWWWCSGAGVDRAGVTYFD